jgi:hydrogenase nickel incorporation protein HypA/HybF
MNRLLCGACGDWHTQVISGDELLLESVELINDTALHSSRSTHPYV